MAPSQKLRHRCLLTTAGALISPLEKTLLSLGSNSSGPESLTGIADRKSPIVPLVSRRDSSLGPSPGTWWPIIVTFMENYSNHIERLMIEVELHDQQISHHHVDFHVKSKSRKHPHVGETS